MNNSCKITNSVVSSLKKLIPDLSQEVIVCCSGGADSMALLFCAQKAGYKVKVVHALHDMREYKEASVDRDVVELFCLNNNIQFNQVHVNLRRPNIPVPSEESYRFSRELEICNFADKNKIRYALTGHHADDQMETLLMKICRGSGLRGISGISPKNVDKRIIFVRPMLDITKDDIYQICKNNNIPYSEDKSNKDTKYTRNYMRQEVIPLLKKAFKNCAENFNQIAKIASDAQKLVEESLVDLKKYETEKDCYDPFSNYFFDDPEISIQIEALRLANNIVIYEWIRSAFSRACKPEYTTANYDSINKFMIEQIINSIRERKNSKFVWPNNVVVRVNQSHVKFTYVKQEPEFTVA